MSSEEDAWNVEAVLDSRKRKGIEREYLVSWAGEPAENDSWECETLLIKQKNGLADH